MKILIAIPSGDEVKANFAECLVGLRTPVDTEILFCVGSLIYDARLNNLGKKIWCDPSIQFGHVSSVVIGGQSFIDEWNNKPKKVTL